MKINFKLFLITTLILTGAFSLFFFSDTKVSAQIQAQSKDKIIVETTGYSVLSASSFVFGGYYSGNVDKKGFTTYFEFKKNDNNLDISTDREETIKIVRDSNVEEHNDFYSSPELKLFSDYFFRAVGYFNDSPDKKYYGETLYMRTGYIPVGMTYPFTTVGNKNVPYTMKFILANILVENITKDSADFKTTVFNKNFLDLNLKIEYGENTEKNFTSRTDILQINDLGKSIITINNLKSKTTYKYRLYDTEDKLVSTSTQVFTTQDVSTPTPTPNPTPTPTPTPSKEQGSTGLVPCTDNCDFSKLFDLINTVINFIFKDLVLPLAAIMFAYAGFELVTSGGSTEKKSKAKSIFLNVAIGLIVAAAAFLIIQTILSIVGARTDIGINWFGFLK